MPRKLSTTDTLIFDFGQSSTRIMVFEHSSGAPRIADFTVLPRDRAGREEDERLRLRKAVEALRLKGRGLAVLTWEEGIIFRQLTLPQMPEDDLKKAFLWEMHEKFSLGLEDSVLGYEAVAEGDTAEGTREKLYSVFHADRKTVMDRVSFIESLGFTVQAVIPAQAALARLTAGGHEVRDTLFFDIGFRAARILVARKGRTLLSRTVLLGGQTLTEMMSTPVPGGALTLGPREAEELKIREGAANPQAEHISLLRPYLEKIVAEIKRSIDFYELQKYSQPIGSVHFTGGGAELKGLKSYMARFLGFDVQIPEAEHHLSTRLDPVKRAQVIAGFDAFAVSLGAALGAEDAVSLLPRQRSTPGQVRAQKTSMRMAIVFVCACAVLLNTWAFLNWQAARSALRTAQGEWAEIERTYTLLEEIKTRHAFIRQALQGDLSHPALLKQLSLATPEKIRLNEVLFSRTNSSLTMRGTVYGAGKGSVKEIAQFIGELMRSPFFSDASLASASQDAQGNTIFEIQCITRGVY